MSQGISLLDTASQGSGSLALDDPAACRRGGIEQRAPALMDARGGNDGTDERDENSRGMWRPHTCRRFYPLAKFTHGLRALLGFHVRSTSTRRPRR
jgi:hypothetical protein